MSKYVFSKDAGTFESSIDPGLNPLRVTQGGVSVCAIGHVYGRVSLERFLAEKTVVLVFSDPVTFADRGFETAPVEYLNAAAYVANQPLLLQTSGGCGDALATHTEHVGDQFLRHH